MQDEVTVLVVEPRSADARRLRWCLTAMGFASRAATSVEQAMRLLRTQVFDGAIVAAEPGLGEAPLLARVRQLPATRFLAATGVAGDREAERLVRLAGAGAYLPRPVSLEAVVVGFLSGGGGLGAQGRETAAGRHPPAVRCSTPKGSERW